MSNVVKWMLQVLSCGGEYDAPAGHIDFPVGEGVQYGHSLACDYTIRGEQGKVRSRIRINQCLNLIACPHTLNHSLAVLIILLEVQR